MTFELRWYQKEAVGNGIEFFNNKSDKLNAIQILPTGSGKSIVIAGIVQGLDGNTLVLQPSKEILEQNYAKLIDYGFEAGIYSASVGIKQIKKITFATIGSIINNHHLFSDFPHIIIDECHLVNSKSGMYKDFIKKFERVKVLGLTATPYRLTNTMEGSMLKFLTRTTPRIFSRVNYYVQNSLLFESNYLAKLEYFDIAGFDRNKLRKNTTGADFTDESLRSYHKSSNFTPRCLKVINRLIEIRKNVLVFTSFIEDAMVLMRQIPGSEVVTGETPKKERERILGQFKSGKIKVVLNVGVLTTGFDYPELETVVIARPTLSLSLYYQMVGRSIRIHPNKKEAFIVDMCDNVRLFGKVEDLRIEDYNGRFSVSTKGKQLTNVVFGRESMTMAGIIK